MPEFDQKNEFQFSQESMRFLDDEIGRICSSLHSSSKAIENATESVKAASKNQIEHQGHSVDRVVNRLNELIKSINDATTAESQHKKALNLLTGIIAVATVVYAAITGIQVYYGIG